MFKNPFSFKGRIRRKEYGLGILLFYGIIMLFAFLIELIKGLLNIGDSELITSILLIPVFIALYWALLAQAVKRSHDVGNSGWYILIPFYTLYLFFANSQYGPNPYGPNPKDEGNVNEIDTIGQIVE